MDSTKLEEIVKAFEAKFGQLIREEVVRLAIEGLGVELAKAAPVVVEAPKRKPGVKKGSKIKARPCPICAEPSRNPFAKFHCAAHDPRKTAQSA